MQAKPNPPSAEEIKRQVKGDSRPWARWVVIVVVLGAICIGVYLWQKPDSSAVSYQTQKAETGDIITLAAATGTLEPTRTVSVGAEISGRIATVLVDENEVVKAGQVLATFDKTTLETQREIAKARLNSSNASVRVASASYDASVTEKNRTQKMVENGVLASAELDSMKTSELRSRAELDRSRSDAAQSKANLGEVDLQLQKAVILSPIDGVIMIRDVEPGQTVASSLQAPELFVVAEDLSKMTLRIWVDEADIGVVKPDQAATFEVSAWPSRKFEAVVGVLSLSPTTTNNVVTYAAELHVDNEDGALRPGMTANANVVTGKRENVLKVPNSALRFRPEVEAAASGSPLVSMPGRRRSNSGGSSEPSAGTRGKVYVLKAGVPQEVSVLTGRSDGRYTEISEGELKAGDEVITGLGQNAPSEKGARKKAAK